MKPFIAIIGNRKAGKSTIIRSITGATSSSFRGRIQDLATGRTIKVIGSSPQETPLTLAALRIILTRTANDAANNGIVCALIPSNPSRRLSIEQVLQEANAHGFSVHCYVLDPEYSGTTGHAPEITTRITNAGFMVQVLNGQRFAQINASIINADTNIAV